MRQLASVRIVIQRVSSASVNVGKDEIAAIGPGLCLLVAIAGTDTPADIEAAATKILGLRVFSDDAGKMNRSIVDVGGEVLVVSQFTLLGDVGKGRRPSFTAAARPDEAAPLIDRMVSLLSDGGVTTKQGEFGAMMDVALVNDGPVTLVLDINQGVVG